MSILQKTLLTVGVLVLGAFGAFVFNVSLLPYFLASTYFSDFQFVKDIKEGKIVVNKTNQVYIQQNTAIQDAVARAENSVVVVGNPSLSAMQSGLIVTSDGLVVTLATNIPLNKNSVVFLNGNPVNFKVVKTDSQNNLAVLKIDKNNLPTVGFSDVSNIKLGQEVFLVAPTSTKENNWLADEGIIKEIDSNSSTGTGQVKTTIPQDVAAQGSPLFNTAGELVGLNYADASGYISAVPIDKIQALLGL